MATVNLSLETKGPHGIPVFGLGTWRSEKGKVKEAVTEAIKLGYKLIDAAEVYQNQDEVGEGIAEAVSKGYISKCEDIWITSKLWNTCHRPEHVRPAAERILRELKVKKINQLLIHWPCAFKMTNTVEDHDFWPKTESGSHLYDEQNPSFTLTWKEMERLVEDGLCDTIGVSNFNESEIDEILAMCCIKPAANQIECHPYLPQDGMRAYLHKHDMALVAYSPLGNLDPNDASKPSPLRDEEIVAIAKKYNKSPAQVIIRWHLQKGNVVIPKTVTLSRLPENADVFDFTISEEDMATLKTLGEKKKVRMVNPGFRPGGNQVFPN